MDAQDVSRLVCPGRDQRVLAGRTRAAVRRVRKGGSEVRPDLQADQPDLGAPAVQRSDVHHREEHVAQLPGDDEHQHQWQNEDGDWNPTDPARFIQPDAFANDKTIWRNQDPVDNNSLATGNTLRNTPTWTPGSFRVAGTWNAPKGVVLSTSYTMVGGPWTGPILKQLAANDPDVLRFGPARFNGTTPVASGGQANPLATRIRFLYPTRGEGQAGLPYVHSVNLKPPTG